MVKRQNYIRFLYTSPKHEIGKILFETSLNDSNINTIYIDQIDNNACTFTM